MGILKGKLFEWKMLAIGLAVIILVAIFSYTPPCQWIENKLTDLRFKLRKPIPLSDRITHIDIDDGSLETIGRWPWPRDKHARLLETLKYLKAKAIAFDVDFFEPGEIFVNRNALSQKILPLFDKPPDKDDSAANYRKYIDELRKGIYETIYDYDLLFSNEIDDIGNVYLTCHLEKHAAAQKQEIPETLKSGRIALPDKGRSNLIDYNYIRLPLPVFTEKARGLGFVDIKPDNDGILRRVTVLKKHEGYLYPQLAFRVACEALGITPEMITIIPGEKIEIKKPDQPYINIPVDNRGDVLINWAGNKDVAWDKIFNHIPYDYFIETVWNAKNILADPESSSPEEVKEAEKIIEEIIPVIKDKICFVGMVATSSTDLKPTPNAPVVPGVMLHTNLINMMLTNNFIRPVPKWLNLLILIIIGILITLIAGGLNPVASVVLTTGIILAYAFISFKVFSDSGVLVDLTSPLLAGFFGFASIKTYRTVTEEKAKKRMQHIFGHYLAPQVISELIKNPEKLKLGGEKRVMTVFFSDIANFTNMSAGLSPEVIMEWINRYLSAMTDIIQEHYGMIDKYEGDAVMALFGAPAARADHAKLACWATLAQLKRLAVLNEEFQKDKLPQVRIRAGINSGEMVVGNLGSSKVLSYTVMGEEVILASRLEGINKYYQTRVLISENTYQMAKDDIEARELGLVRAKGMERPVRIYELIARKGEADSRTLELVSVYNSALESYYAHQWDKTIGILNACRRINPDDGPTVRLLGQCYKFKQLLPDTAIDTTHTLSSK